MAQDQNNLLWIDMEMTGLQPDTDKIIEIAIVVTDSQLNTVAEAPVLVVHQLDSVLDGMDAWNKGTHGRSGLIEKVKARIPNIQVGSAADAANEMGPLITGEHRDKVAGYIAGAAAEGATLVVDGRDGAPGGGFFLKPSLIDNARPGMKCYDDEIFGPVLMVTRVKTYAEGLALINDNQYGNGTAIFTRDGGVARQFQFDVQVGMVGINVPIPVPVSYYSFGGWKASLFGDQHMYGPDGINFFTRSKVITSRWPDPATSTVDLGFPTNR